MSPAIRTVTLAAAPILVLAACASDPASVQTTGAGESLASRHTGTCTDTGECADGRGGGVSAGAGADAEAADAAAPDAAGAADACADAGGGGPGQDAGADAADASTQFTSCTMDSDCIAVPTVACCHNGWMTAVNRAQADAYEASFTCPQQNPICPQYQVIDSRVPECDNGTDTCTMVRVDQIVCGSFIVNQHHCPAGYVCDYAGHVPDVGGKCVPDDGGAP